MTGKKFKLFVPVNRFEGEMLRALMISNGSEVAEVSPEEEASKAKSSAQLSSTKPLKFATPAEADTEVVPVSEAPPGLLANPMEIEL